MPSTYIDNPTRTHLQIGASCGRVYACLSVFDEDMNGRHPAMKVMFHDIAQARRIALAWRAEVEETAGYIELMAAKSAPCGEPASVAVPYGAEAVEHEYPAEAAE